MNLKELEYIVRISEEKNVTHAAQKLYVTPSALNQQLLRLERELGTQLFYRSRSGWMPTPAGELYLETARTMLMMKKQAYQRMQDVAEVQRGTLDVGLTPGRSGEIFVNIYPIFHERYPEIVIHIHEASTRKQQKMLSKGELDVGFLSLEPSQRTDDDYQFVYAEEVGLYISSQHELLQHAKTLEDGSLELDLAHFDGQPFALVYQESTLRDTIDRQFTDAGVTPVVLFDSAYIRTIMPMVSAGVCHTLCPWNPRRPVPENVTICHLPGRPHVHLEVCTRRGAHRSKPMQFFIDLVTDFWLEKAGLKSPLP